MSHSEVSSDSMHSVGLSTTARSSTGVATKLTLNDIVGSSELRQKDVDVAIEPQVKRPSVLRTTASYIIATEFCERLAYYGFAGSLVLFFETVLDMSNADSVNSFSLWSGAVYVTPLLGGYIADAWLGRYKTILAFSVIYVLGLGVFLIGAAPTLGKSSLAGLVFGGMYIVALGAGGIKPNASTMGADQFDINIEQDKKEAKQFFSYFYWSINLGALVAYTLVAYICQYGLPFLGGPDWGFFVGYCIPTIALTLGVLMFASGSARYRKNPPGGSMITVVAKIFYEAVFGASKRPIDDPNTLEGEKLLHNVVESGTEANEIDTSSLCVLPRHWLDRANVKFGGNFSPAQVECVKYVVKLFPFLIVMIPYWGIYSQTKTAFQVQGCQMDLNIGDFQLPVSAMNIFNNIAILTLVPLFDQVLYPYLRRKNIEPTMLQKIALGFVFALLAMICEGIVEVMRQEYAPTPGGYFDEDAKNNISPCKNIDNYSPVQYQKWYAGDDVSKPMYCNELCPYLNNDDNHYLNLTCISCENIPQMSGLSIFWQIPGFIFIGISEIFASITSLEFFYSQAPSNMRSVSQSFNLFTNALGSWLTIPLTLLVNIDPNNEWIASNVDEGHLSYYFFLLAGLMTCALAVFLYLSRGYVYANPQILEALAVATSDAPKEGDDKDTSINVFVEEQSSKGTGSQSSGGRQHSSNTFGGGAGWSSIDTTSRRLSEDAHN